MTKQVFVTATGTDIGKTYVSALIVKAMRENGFNCGYYKPVLSGVKVENRILIESDCNYVIEKSALNCNPNDCVGYWWEEAVSPHLASERAGQIINTNFLKQKLEHLKSQYDYLLIEGAGGITCPLRLTNNEKYLLKDLIREFDTQIIIIADAGLGTINSALLTVDYARNNNIKIAGIILNNYDKNNFMHKDNLKQVEYLTKIKVLATIEKNQTDLNYTNIKNCFV